MLVDISTIKAALMEAASDHRINHGGLTRKERKERDTAIFVLSVLSDVCAGVEREQTAQRIAAEKDKEIAELREKLA